MSDNLPTAIQLTRDATPAWIEPGNPDDATQFRLDPDRPYWRLATALKHWDSGDRIVTCTVDRGTSVVADPWTVVLQWPAGREDEVMRVDLTCGAGGVQAWAVHPVAGRA